jgi:hypothetical protein
MTHIERDVRAIEGLDDASYAEVLAAWQRLINSGDAWRLTPAIANIADELIKGKLCRN